VLRLPEDSLTVALANGGRKTFGWSTDRYLLADIYDSINVNTRATGSWKKGKDPNFKPWPRPSADNPAEKKRVTVADLYARFSRR
jgi:hypothetical protein